MSDTREDGFRAATGAVKGGRKPATEREIEATVELDGADAIGALSAPSLAAEFAKAIVELGDDVIAPLLADKDNADAVNVLETLPSIAKNLSEEFARLEDEKGEGAPSVTGSPLELGAALLSASMGIRKSFGDMPDEFRFAVDAGIDGLRAFADLPEVLTGRDEAVEFYKRAGSLPAPVRSPGAEIPILRSLLARVPNHETYIEPYAGAAPLFWAKARAKREILADRDRGVVAFYKFLQAASNEDLAWFRSQKWSLDPEHFEKLKGQSPRSLRGRAYRFKYLNLFSIQGRGARVDHSDRTAKQTGEIFLKNLEGYRARLEGVEILDADGLEVARKYDGEGVFMYLDPPLSGARMAEEETEAPEWSDDDVSKLSEGLSALKGRVLVSTLDKIDPGEGWRRYNFARALKGAPLGKRRSLIWNYDKGEEPTRKSADGVVACEFCDGLADLALAWNGGIVGACSDHEDQARDLIEEVHKADIVEQFECGIAKREEVSKLGVDEINPRALAAVDDRELLSINRRLHQIYGGNFEGNNRVTAGDLNREAVVNAYIFVAAEMEDRDMKPKQTALAIEAEQLRATRNSKTEKRELAVVNPGGEGTGELIKLDDVLPLFSSFKVRMPFLWLVGSLANHGKTRGDIDLLVKGPLSPELLQVIKFRLARMLPPELSKRLSVIDDDLGGPFTDHVELADLVVEVRPEFATKEMRLQKADDPLLDWPKEEGPLAAVFQYHFRGKSLHVDLRMKVAPDFLVGWTLSTQRPGVVPVVDTVEEAKRIGDGFSPDGDRYGKPFRSPARVAAFQKMRQPIEWLEISGRKFEPGEVGASPNEVGVIVAVDRPSVEWGIQKPFFHEYFFTGKDSTVQGIMAFRQLTGTSKAIKLEGEGGDPYEQGRRTPEGETFWTGMITKSTLPSVLKPRAVREGTMPPNGKSALPRSLEVVTPKQFRYWEATGKEAQDIRDALVKERFFTDENVRIVDGQFRRVIAKRFLYTGDGSDYTPTKALGSARFALSWQRWKGQRVVRGGPSRQIWILSIKGLPGWELQRDPLAEKDPITAVKRSDSNEALFSLEGDVEPGRAYGGEVLNDTKATPSEISIVDEGTVEFVEMGPGVVRARFNGKKLRGLYTLAAEEKGSSIWTFAPGDDMEKSDDGDPWDSDDVHLYDADVIEGEAPRSESAKVETPERKVKDGREIRAIVYERHPVKDSPGVYNFLCAIGPVNPDQWKATVEVDGKTYAPIGSTSNSDADAKVGDVIQVEATEILVDASGDKHSVHWFTPNVIGVVTGRPMKAEEVVALAKPEEIKKVLDGLFEVEREVPIIKAAGEKRIVYGIVLVPEEVDAQGDIYSEEAIAEAAHGYMERFANMGIMHRELANGKIKILESFLAPVDMTIGGQKVKRGTWLLVVRVIDDKLWSDVKTGKWTGFSIGGSARRVPVSTSA